MMIPIDIVFIDVIRRVVVRAIKEAQPTCHFNTIKIPLEQCAALELPAGTIELTGTMPGDSVSLMSSTHCPQDELNQIGAL
jgi:uncharacterized membrane protein (UPF0127 family)